MERVAAKLGSGNACVATSSDEARSRSPRKRRTIAVLSFALEANVFNPVPRRLRDFQVLRGHDYSSNERQAGFVSVLRRESPWLFYGVDVRFLVLYRGFCGGLMPAEDLEAMKAAALHELRNLRTSPNGLFLDLHGAMGAAGCDDVEADIVEACRAQVGAACLFAASFDLHGNISERMLRALDMVTAYRTMPHVDMEETKRKGLRMLLHVMQTGGPRPVIAMASVPAIVPGDQVLTTEGRGRQLYSSLAEIEEGAGILDASVFVGHQHADEERVRAAVVLTGLPCATGRMREAAACLAKFFWKSRAEFAYPTDCPLMDWGEGLCQAVEFVEGAKGTVLMGDFGDNLTAGATGDVPFVLRKLLVHFADQPVQARVSVLLAGLVDPAAVERCCRVGAGGNLAVLQVGAGLTMACGCPEDFYGEEARPVQLEDVSVRAIVEAGNGRWAVVSILNVVVLLQEKPWAFFSASDFDCLPMELQPQRFSIVVLKAGINIVDVAKGIGAGRSLLVNTLGATTEPLGERVNLRRPIWTGPAEDFEWSISAEDVTMCSR